MTSRQEFYFARTVFKNHIQSKILNSRGIELTICDPDDSNSLGREMEWPQSA